MSDKDQSSENVESKSQSTEGNVVPIKPEMKQVSLGAITTFLNASANTGRVLVPSMDLRQVIPPVGLPYIQQRFYEPGTGYAVWRNLQQVVGIYPDNSLI